MSDYASKAAAWWSARLRDAAGVGDNGDRASQHSAMACVMTSMIRGRNPPTEQNCAAFEIELANRIDAAFTIIGDGHGRDYPDVGCNWYYDNNGWDDGGPDLCLTVDYHPCSILLAALESAGVEKNVREVAALPLKTAMRISRRRTILKHGYGAKFIEIDGPRWGASYEEHCRASAAREAMLGEDAWDAWRNDGRRGPSPLDWKGPIRSEVQP